MYCVLIINRLFVCHVFLSSDLESGSVGLSQTSDVVFQGAETDNSTETGGQLREENLPPEHYNTAIQIIKVHKNDCYYILLVKKSANVKGDGKTEKINLCF